MTPGSNTPATPTTARNCWPSWSADIPGVELMFPVQANGVFLQLSEPAIAALTAKGWRFYTFIGKGGARFMCSWDTEEERVRELAADIRTVMGA